MNASPLFGLCLNRFFRLLFDFNLRRVARDMASFATRLSIGRWATFQRKAHPRRIPFYGIKIPHSDDVIRPVSSSA
jgi:hypothetical protein